MPLSNDFKNQKSNNTIDEVEVGMKAKDTKDLPNNNLFITDKKTEFSMPVKAEEFESYFEYAYKSGALKNEYSVSILNFSIV